MLVDSQENLKMVKLLSENWVDMNKNIEVQRLQALLRLFSFVFSAMKRIVKKKVPG